MGKSEPTNSKKPKRLHIILEDGNTYVFNIKKDITAYESAMYFELLFLGAAGQGKVNTFENEERIKVLKRHLDLVEES